MNRTDRNHCRRERDVELPAGNHLQCENDLRRDDDRVDAEPRIRAVCLFAEDFDAEGIDRGELRSGTIRDLADGISRSDMQSEYGVDFRVVERALFHHQCRAAFLALRRALFGRLK